MAAVRTAAGVVRVRTAAGVACEVELKSELTVASLKQLVAIRVDIDAHKMRLVWKSRVLSMEHWPLMARYGIATGDVIFALDHTNALQWGPGALPAARQIEDAALALPRNAREMLIRALCNSLGVLSPDFGNTKSIGPSSIAEGTAAASSTALASLVKENSIASSQVSGASTSDTLQRGSSAELVRSQSVIERVRRESAEDDVRRSEEQHQQLDGDLAKTKSAIARQKQNERESIPKTTRVARAKLDAAIRVLQQRNTGSVLETATKTMLAIVSKPLSHPAEPRYRKVRTGNPKIDARVFCATGARAVLEAAGFHGGDILALPPLGEDDAATVSRLEYAQAALGSLLKRKNAEQEAARLLRVAGVRAEEAKRREREMQLLDELEEDKHVRSMPGWEAKAFVKGGKDAARVPGDGRG